GWLQMRTSWWGILGLIGWAYLTACIVFLLFRKDLVMMLGAMALLYICQMTGADAYSGWVPVIPRFVDLGFMFGTHSAIAVCGMILGIVLKSDEIASGHWQRLRWGAMFGLGLFLAGLLLHSMNDLGRMFHFEKNAATPAWGLLSSAFTIWIWVFIYYITDLRGFKSWADIIVPSSKNPLLAYILADFVYASLTVTGLDGFYFGTLGQSFAVGFCRSVAFAVFINWLTGFLNRSGLRLRL
ncbi:hypothetical protein K8I31_09280, partial [bacterium]|nr:hypothetical protein [bacterium]